MGIETLVIAGLTAASALSSVSNAKKQAKAVAQEGEIESRNLAKRIRYDTATQKTSFLNSGLALDGTPMDVINETYTTGLEDLGSLRTSYNNKSKSILAQGRSQALSTIIGSFSMAGLGSSASSGFSKWFGSTAVGEKAAFGLNNMGFGETAYNMLDV